MTFVARIAALLCFIAFAVPAGAAAQAGEDDYIFASSFEQKPRIDIGEVVPRNGETVSAQYGTIVSATVYYTGDAMPRPLKMVVDGVDVSARVRSSGANVWFAHEAPPALGAHTVELRAGDARLRWAYTVAGAPAVVSFTPDDATFPFHSRPVIEAHLRDAAADLDAASIKLYRDGYDVTAQATVTWVSPREARLRYEPAEPFEAGDYAARVAVANTLGVFTDARIAFSIEQESTWSLALIEPAAGTTVLQPNLPVVLRADASNAELAELTVNGVVFEESSVDDTGALYAGTIALVPGANIVTAVARFDDGTERSTTIGVIYEAPARVTITGPKDFATLGPVENPDVAPGSATDLTGTVQRPVTVTGTTSAPVAAVTVNQQRAVVSPDGRSFTFERFFLHEGTNLLSVDAVDARGRASSAQATVYVDQTAPLLTIEAPASDAVTSAVRVDVRGIANDAVEGGLNAPEPGVVVANAANATSTVATVGDRYYVARDVPLEIGANRITVTAKDALGNARARQLTVTRVAAGSRRITLLSGDRQGAAILAPLPQPLAVVAIDRDGLPLAGLALRFDVLRGSGSLAAAQGGTDRPDGIAPARNLALATDASGRAQVWLTLGNEAAQAGNMVRVSADGVSEDVVFTATGQRGAPAMVLVNGVAGTQFASTDSQPVEAMSAVVLDTGRNAMAGTSVRFTVEEGDARFDASSAPGAAVSPDGLAITVTADKNGVASVRPLTGAEPGTVVVRAEALTGTDTIGNARFRLMVLARQNGPTGFSGVVLDHTGEPLAGVRLSISRTALSAVSDAAGRFVFDEQVPPGKIDLHVDGTALHRMRGTQTLQYPGLHFETVVIQGQMNQLPHPIYLPPIDVSRTQIAGGDTDVTLTVPGIEGFEMVVKARSVTFPDGSRVGPLVVTPVHGDRLPMVPPGGFGSFGAIAWTIQPTGARFDPPVEVRIPNTQGLARGETLPIVQWDHDLATFVPMGRGTVSEDATRIVSDAGSGITKAGWGGGPPPVPPNDATEDSCPAGSRRAECNCKIDEVQGACVARVNTPVSYAALSPTPDELAWTGGLGANPASATGGTYGVTFVTQPTMMSYQTEVLGYCVAKPSRKKKKTKIGVGEPCSAYEPIQARYSILPGMGGDPKGNFGVSQLGTTPNFPIKAPSCVGPTDQWEHRVSQVGHGSQIGFRNLGKKELQNANSPLITDATCKKVLADLTPTMAAYGIRIAPYDEYVPTPIVIGHENFHVSEHKVMLVDPIVDELKQYAAQFPTNVCWAKNQEKKFVKEEQKIRKRHLKVYEAGATHEQRAYQQYENPELAIWRTAIRARAVAANWRPECR